MAKFERFEDIEAWQEARKLTKQIYTVTNKSTFSRDFGLRDQIRRAAVSIMSNIAEGFERGGDKEFSQFVSFAKASSSEVRSHLYVALDAGHFSIETFNRLANVTLKINKMLAGLLKYLHNSEFKGSKYK